MKKQHLLLIAAAVIGIIVGTAIVLAAVLMFSPGSTQTEAEAETQIEHQTEDATQAETEEVASIELTDAEFVKAMPEDEQAYLIAIICLATEDGHAPSEVAETIAENFDEISEDYAQRLVSASLLTVCNQASE